jgi:acyl carrier protein
MTIELFIEHFAAQLEDTDPATITPETVFRDIEEWDSLMALSLIAMADEEYQVKLTGEDIRTSKTVAELFDKVKSKLA